MLCIFQSIVIPDDAAFVEIIDDKKASANRIFFPTSDLKIGRRVDAGRVLIVTNSDAEATSGDASIPPKTTVLFVSDGARFVSVDALRAPMTELDGVLSLRAAADLDIGNHSLTAAAFILAADQAPDRNTLLYAGPSGAIRSANGLTYARGLLTTPSLTVGSIGGDVDFQFHMLE